MQSNLAEQIKGKLVLVVDDEPGIREVVCAIFSACGAEIIEAENGIDAAKKSENMGVDLIVSDIKMPEGDGIGLLATIRSRDGSCPPFLFVTGSDEYSESQLKENGAQGLIPKPFSAKALLAIASEAIVTANCPVKERKKA